MIEVASHIIEEARELAAELVKNNSHAKEIRSTGLFVTTNPDKKTVIHIFECENVCCYITLGK